MFLWFTGLCYQPLFVRLAVFILIFQEEVDTTQVDTISIQDMFKGFNTLAYWVWEYPYLVPFRKAIWCFMIWWYGLWLYYSKTLFSINIHCQDVCQDKTAKKCQHFVCLLVCFRSLTTGQCQCKSRGISQSYSATRWTDWTSFELSQRTWVIRTGIINYKTAEICPFHWLINHGKTRHLKGIWKCSLQNLTGITEIVKRNIFNFCSWFELQRNIQVNSVKNYETPRPIFHFVSAYWPNLKVLLN